MLTVITDIRPGKRARRTGYSFSKEWFPWEDKLVGRFILCIQSLIYGLTGWHTDVHARHSHAYATIGLLAPPIGSLPMASESERSRGCAISQDDANSQRYTSEVMWNREHSVQREARAHIFRQ